MTMRALLFVPFVVAVLSAGSPDKGSFTSGVWHGKANYDGDGKFSDCTMMARSKSGVLLGFVISKDFDWGLVLADERRGFEVGTTVPVSLLIDARKPMRAIAKVIDAHGILIPLENTNPVLDALRHGKVLTIVADGAKFSFKLTRAHATRSRRLLRASRDTAAARGWSSPRELQPESSSRRISGAGTASRYRRA
jgi:hypothetical protein